MTRVTKIIKYRKRYAIVKIYNNIIFVVKLLRVEKVLKKILSYSLEDNGKLLIWIYFEKEQ